ncbi:MAG: prepilin-type N-terminal cleavage/methylation domain-containing protein [Candidatus Eisenbacteria bacterium]|uniref:Prepilin-type N-terminal cleavage/methylation domain-containing protein n=1 Tax=Eiseniibacteriota bacterium TaxID=2212470 RepID=A0A849SWA2_UNCEI|nr:prepilin-type N-terminal cleavage/methylation domain-containing protein [Candidatus Eisenbacteria bacterium]
MNLNHASTRNDARGFSLVEMMITLSMLAVIMLMLYATLFGAQNAATETTRRAYARNSGREAIQLIERDLRMAGSGWGTLPVQISNNGAAGTLGAITPGPASGQSDSLRMLGTFGSHSVLSTAMANAAATTTVDSIGGFNAGDFFVITNGIVAHLFNVTSVNTGTRQLAHATSSSWNVAGGHAQFPAAPGYRVGTDVYEVTQIAYRVDSLNYRRRTLVRQENGGIPQIVAYGVDSLKIWYRMRDGSITRSPGQIIDIREIVPILYTRSGKSARLDSTWTYVHPRSF